MSRYKGDVSNKQWLSWHNFSIYQIHTNYKSLLSIPQENWIASVFVEPFTLSTPTMSVEGNYWHSPRFGQCSFYSPFVMQLLTLHADTTKCKQLLKGFTWNPKPYLLLKIHLIIHVMDEQRLTSTIPVRCSVVTTTSLSKVHSISTTDVSK